jgi:acetyltransferase-like isoleucine patch superfamily enzyme
MDKISLATLAEIEGCSGPRHTSLPGILGKARLFGSESRNSALHCVGYVPSRYLRRSLYQAFGMKIARAASIAPGCWVLGGPGRITIGAGTVINRGVVLDGRFPLTIGENVSISIQTMILTLQHDLAASDFCAVGAPVIIGDRAFLGARALVLPGITIGEGAAVGAGAVVTQDVEPFAIVAGVPAKVIGSRPRALTYRFSPGA